MKCMGIIYFVIIYFKANYTTLAKNTATMGLVMTADKAVSLGITILFFTVMSLTKTNLIVSNFLAVLLSNLSSSLKDKMLSSVR